MNEAWRPSAGMAELRARAGLIAKMREYLTNSGALEVSTPVLSNFATTEPSLSNLELADASAARFLRTSPESALKRLLAAGSGDVFEIGPAFRAAEQGRRHLVEFTLLEWYRCTYDHHRLMDDVAGLLAAVGFQECVDRQPYGALFANVLGEDPHGLDTARLVALARECPITLSAADREDRALLFDILFAHCIEPRLAAMGAVFIYDFPRELRAYARLSRVPPAVAERFELVIDGVEIANGYHEIVDPAEQAECFAADNALRRQRGVPSVAADGAWLAALAAGMPAAAGVALGVERLHMALGRFESIDEVVAFAVRAP